MTSSKFDNSGSPDAWVPRDPKMLRLTGKYPFNVHVPMKGLFAQGFLTPSNYFYVRNHGAVPKVDQQMVNEWKLRIHG
jgi:nitrate reductase (NAD(P)H)